MSTKQFLELTQLAEASYAEFDSYRFIEALTREGMSYSQADALDDKWQLVPGAHRPNTASGAGYAMGLTNLYNLFTMLGGASGFSTSGLTNTNEAVEKPDFRLPMQSTLQFFEGTG
jgi:hypothetical protein